MAVESAHYARWPWPIELHMSNSQSHQPLIYFLTLLLCSHTPTVAGTLVFDSRQDWVKWTFPTGLLAIDDGVRPRSINGNVNAALNAHSFIYKNAKGMDVRGGVRNAGSNPTDAELAIDGDPRTWWQPDPSDSLGRWKFELDLGRLVQASKIRLVFPDEDGARPLRQFRIFASEGARQVIGKDLVLFDRVGGTTRPNYDTVREYELRTIEPGNAKGEYLATVGNDTLNYIPVQYVRIVADERNHGAAIAEIEVETLGENIALDTFERGGSLRAGNNVQNVFAIADGSATTWWSLNGLPVDWRDSGMWYEWDLGATFWLDRLTVFEPPFAFATTGFSNSQQIMFEIATSDGTPVPIADDRNIQSPFDYEILSLIDNVESGGRGRTRNFDLRFPPRKVRYLFYHHQAPERGVWRFVFHMIEVFLYGAGFPAEVVMVSPFIDMGGASSLRRIHWQATNDVDTRVEIRTRTGDTVEEEIFYYRKNGEEISEKNWKRLPASQKLEPVSVTRPSNDWSTWSSAYEESGQVFASPSPRQFVQIEAKLTTDNPDIAPVLHSISLDFDDPLVSRGVFAAITPREAGLDSVTHFALKLENRAILGDRGFNRFMVRLPGELEGEVAVKVAEEEIVPQSIFISGDTLTIDVPRRIQSETLEVVFPLRLKRNAAVFDGWISLREEFEVRQGIRPAQPAALTVFVPEISGVQELIRRFDLSTTVLTPNGDGVNDRLELDLLVVKSQVAPIVGVYALDGRLIAEVQGLSGGYVWNGTDRSGRVVPPGVYVLNLRVDTDAGTERRQKVISVAF